MGISLYSLGAAEEVIGSKHVIEAYGKKYLIEKGYSHREIVQYGKTYGLD